METGFRAIKNLHEGGLAPSFSAGLGSLSAGGTFKEEPKGCRAVDLPANRNS